MKKVILIISGFILISFILTSCAITPKMATDIDDKRCNLITKKLELEMSEPLSLNCSLNEIVLCLGIGALFTATTGIISGSIVLVGNTIHWLEKPGKCNDSFINTYVTKHNQFLLEQNGQLVELTE
ncbi:MAG: hypothetical protein DRR19_05970 [Candidatus Parabeggiatoa sp. nov. 1]|nr:MAG: hypothetical protein DRR19_05970 [Gammaproteobacteria bacterium]